MTRCITRLCGQGRACQELMQGANRDTWSGSAEQAWLTETGDREGFLFFSWVGSAKLALRAVA